MVAVLGRPYFRSLDLSFVVAWNETMNSKFSMCMVVSNFPHALKKFYKAVEATFKDVNYNHVYVDIIVIV